MESAQAFIAFLRCEAKQAEERAKSLRATALIIEANSQEGRGKKKRKREKRRAPTAYTLFVHENYDNIRKSHGDDDMPSREIMALVGQQWAATSTAERQMWQFRAEQMKHQQQGDEELPELPAPVVAQQQPDDGGGKKRARKQAMVAASAVHV
ncbi:expressed unknown protein [Seminavis robusta]|uniref:HMG box domain-containing protein n=1 Tax=Seminavis robusta TaxID=568900 RepID=A0A9N8DAW0_9STRA|nr:expressed unknown protein [Seminavis robusta]|eukprot:Sro65_g036740.1 n/a (153) ;mRNA; r:62481-63171